MTIKFAPSNRIAQYRAEVDQLLLAVAKYMIEEGESPEEWVSFTFVSNESSLGDFLMEANLAPLAEDLQLSPVTLRDRLIDVAMTMHQRKSLA